MTLPTIPPVSRPAREPSRPAPQRPVEEVVLPAPYGQAGAAIRAMAENEGFTEYEMNILPMRWRDGRLQHAVGIMYRPDLVRRLWMEVPDG